MSTDVNDVVLVTGFGPFQFHPVNASWEVVKLIPGTQFEGELNARVVIQEIQVSYDTAAKSVPELWESMQPMLVVHVGVSSQATAVTLEKRARNKGYTKPDINNQIPPTQQCYCNGPQVIDCGLNLGLIAQQVIASAGVQCITSTDAGQYLCEYTYFLSLKQNPSASLFVHIPRLDEKYTTEQLANAVKVILHEALKQVREMTTDFPQKST